MKAAEGRAAMADCQKPWSAQIQPKQDAKKIPPNSSPFTLHIVNALPSLFVGWGTACTGWAIYQV